MITAVYDNLSIDTEFARNYLKADPADDPVIELMIKSIKRKADTICQNEFKEGVPEGIELWVLEMLGRKYNRRANGLSSENVAGYGSISWNDEDYTEIWPYRKAVGT